MSLAGARRAAQRALRTELACARALLDELEAVLDAENEERTQNCVVIQMADQFARVAHTMTFGGKRAPRASAIANRTPT